MTTVYQYRVYCVQEGTYVLTWGTTPPTLCPNNHEDRTITSAVVVQTITPDNLTVNEPYNGYFHTFSVCMDIPEMSPSDIYYQTIEFDSDIILWNAEFMPKDSMIGDELSITAAPETIVGVLTAPGSIGDTILNVTSTVVTNSQIIRGINLVIDDGVNKQDLGVITNLDSTNNQVTVKNPLLYNYSAGIPVKVTVYILKNVCIDYSGTLVGIGKKGFQGKPIKKGQNLRVEYHNKTGTAKSLRIRVETYNLG